MPGYTKNDIVLVRYPFSDLSSAKVRPAIVVSARHKSQDIFVVPLTSRTTNLLPNEFVLADWQVSGLNVPTAVKRGIYTIHANLVVKSVGKLMPADAVRLDRSLRVWLGLS